ncbi:IS66 family insertion sequence element accessory protein TnpB [Serratia symbiotica]|uniref:IS66 family insertion sequence element accessory protein TnpB n=1 Tax=Serratia symbiotica TaxID=138074 RepID=UPI003D9A3C30
MSFATRHAHASKSCAGTSTGGRRCLRRLRQGHFIWPRQGDVAWMLSTEQADGLMKGIDGQRVDGLDLTSWK